MTLERELLQCVFLTYPKVKHDEFTQLYITYCLAAESSTSCGLLFHHFSNNILYVTTLARNLDPRQILAAIKCLAYLTCSPIAIPLTSFFKNTVIRPIILTPTLPKNTCIFNSCFGQIIKVQPLFHPEILLDYDIIQFITTNGICNKYDKFKQFLNMFNIPHSVDIDQLPTDDDKFWSCECSCETISNVLRYLLMLDNQSKSFNSISDVHKYTYSGVVPSSWSPELPLSNLSCPVFDYINKHNIITQMRLSKLLDINLLQHEIENIAAQIHQHVIKE